MCAHAHSGHTHGIIKHSRKVVNLGDIAINQSQQQFDKIVFQSALRFIRKATLENI